VPSATGAVKGIQNRWRDSLRSPYDIGYAISGSVSKHRNSSEVLVVTKMDRLYGL
jgi:hypothetical protein